jgi:hypothetical protein
MKPSAKFNANFDAIFGKPKPIVRGSFVQDSKTGKLVPRGTLEPTPRVNAPSVMKPLQDFKSPIDGSIISSRAQLKRHNEKHGVTNSADYSKGYIEKKANERNAAGERHLKQTRRADIHHAIDTHSR